MFDLYYWPTPNGWKVSIMLEECGLEYEVHPIHIGKGDQFKPEFLAISPNNRIPALVDPDAEGGTLAVFESGAILVYLAEKTGRLLPDDPHGRYDALQWVFWQMGGLGPMAGQLAHFMNYAEERIEYAVERYRKEFNRLLGVLDRRLADRPCVAGDYTIADVACWPWVRAHERLDQPLDEFPNVARWFAEVASRPAVQRGIDVGSDWWGRTKIDEGSRKTLFEQTAQTVVEMAGKAAAADD